MATYNRIQRACVLNATIMTMQPKRATRVQSDNGVMATYNRIQCGCVLNATIYEEREREKERDPIVDINSRVKSL